MAGPGWTVAMRAGSCSRRGHSLIKGGIVSGVLKGKVNNGNGNCSHYALKRWN